MKKDQFFVAIDCRMIQCSGIGRFLRGILPFLLRHRAIQFRLFGSTNLLSPYKDSHVEIIACEIPIFSWQEFFLFPRKELKGCDIFFTPNYNIPGFISIPIFSTIHDLLFLDIPSLKGFVGRTIRKLASFRAIKISKNIFTVSEFSKSRILHHFPNTKHITVCYNGVEFPDSLTEKIPDSLKSIDSFFLYVGNIKPHKGIHLLLDAFQRRKEEGDTRKLVIVGNQHDFKTNDENLSARLNSLSDNHDIIFTGFISQHYLIWLMKNASCLIQPSLYEGFGLPPLEAMHLGTPVILSDIPAFKELYNSFPVHFFKSNDSTSLSRAMKKEMSRIELDSDLKSLYNYKRTAEIIINSLNHYIKS